MKRTALALTLLLALPALAQEANEWERPFTGYLPDPAAGERDSWADAIPRAYGCHVLDAETGAPLPGARVSYHAEVIDGSTADPSPRLGLAVTDLDGHAWLAASDWPGGTHWLVTAPGYAPEHSFTFAPARTIRLERGADIEGRLLDPLGRAVAGARVDWFRGCPHAPVARTARTGPGGRFTLHDVAPGGGFLWVVSPEGRYVYNDPLHAGRFGQLRQDLVLRSGWTARGRLVDAAERPLAGAVVRYAEFPRGPVTTTDAAGGFVLHGLPEDALLRFHANEGRPRFGDWRDRTPFVVRLDRFGSVLRPAAVSVDVRLTVSDRRPIEALDLRLTDLDTGHAWLVEGDDADERDAGASWTVRCDVPPGEYEIAPATPFESATFRARRARVAAGTTIDIAVDRQPRLAIDGEFPSSAHEVALVVPRGEIDSADPDDLPPVPATGPAVLRVRPDIDAPVFFFPAAPTQGAVRRVRVRMPEAHRIRLASGAPIDSAALRFGRTEPSSSVDDDGCVTTYATGKMQIDIESPAWRGTRRFDIELPARAAEIALNHGDARPVADEPEAEDVQAAPPAGPCTLRLVCLDPDGEPLACAVSVDGVSHWTAEGVLELNGLPAGARHVIASPRDPDYLGRELRLVLADGVRERTVRFPPR